MARTRTIDRQAVLEAAERVVARDGAARLTLDAVANEAGISKASVLYDYKTKQALIKAVIGHRMATEVSRLRSYIQMQGETPDATILGLIAAADADNTGLPRNVALDLAVALNRDTDLRSAIQEKFAEFIHGIESTSSRPDRAKVAFLAIEGLKFLECFGFYEWKRNERCRLIEDIRALLGPDAPTEAVED